MLKRTFCKAIVTVACFPIAAVKALVWKKPKMDHFHVNTPWGVRHWTEPKRSKKEVMYFVHKDGLNILNPNGAIEKISIDWVNCETGESVETPFVRDHPLHGNLDMLRGVQE